jgi:hypothetical protein
MEARAFSPGSVGNVGVGFDILGHSIAGIGDIATVRRIDGRAGRAHQGDPRRSHRPAAGGRTQHRRWRADLIARGAGAAVRLRDRTRQGHPARFRAGRLGGVLRGCPGRGECAARCAARCACAVPARHGRRSDRQRRTARRQRRPDAAWRAGAGDGRPPDEDRGAGRVACGGGASACGAGDDAARAPHSPAATRSRSSWRRARNWRRCCWVASAATPRWCAPDWTMCWWNHAARR